VTDSDVKRYFKTSAIDTPGLLNEDQSSILPTAPDPANPRRFNGALASLNGD
jgi:hypothetical protein